METLKGANLCHLLPKVKVKNQKMVHSMFCTIANSLYNRSPSILCIVDDMNSYSAIKTNKNVYKAHCRQLVALVLKCKTLFFLHQD